MRTKSQSERKDRFKSVKSDVVPSLICQIVYIYNPMNGFKGAIR